MRRWLLCSLLGLPCAAVADTYSLDTAHSMPSFSFRHLNLSSFRGRFDRVSGTIEFNPAQHSGNADVVIAIDSVSTGVPLLDQFLKSPRFFDAATFPSATFKSTAFTFSGEQVVSVAGKLSLHGITKPVTLKLAFFACHEHALLKVPACGADARLTLKRSDFGLDAFIGNDSDEVELDIPVEALKAQRQ
jgi:polyisoprenoid-binding protein YceI